MVDWLGYRPPLSVVAGLIGLEVAYLLCVGVYRDRLAGARPVPVLKRVAFSSGVLVMLLALTTPLDTIGDAYLFTAHMVQHLLLTLGAAPLLLAGTPGWLLRLVLSAVKFATVVGFFMHLRFDNPLFLAVFGFGLAVAGSVITAFMFLFGQYPQPPHG